MSALAKLKKQAVQLEHDRQYDKALALYARIFEEASADDEELDVALYNRAGDVALRLGDGARAVSYYERALDRYATGGLLNNAIALGAKILRHAPDRVVTHYTLGVLYAKKGFRSDARQHFLSYAERMHRAQQATEAARSVADYVVLCDGVDDARRGLERHLASGAPRAPELAQQLASLLNQALRAAGQLGQDGAPVATSAAQRSSDAAGADLIFLDLAPAEEEPPSFAVSASDDVQGWSAPVADAPAFDAPIYEPDDFAPPAFEPPAFEPPTLDGDAFASPTLELDVGHAEPAPRSAPVALAALPGELPPLTPAMVALDGGPATEPAPAWSEATPAFAVEDEHIVAPQPLVVDLDAAAAELDYLPLDEPEELAPAQVVAPALARHADDGDMLDLGAWLRDSEPELNTRLVAPVIETTGDEQADFQATLQAFKAGIARNLEDADFDAHYDLGVAYREMGLLDEAVGEFQKAAHAPGRPLRALEALAGCFHERGEPELVLSTLAGIAPQLAGGATPGEEAPRHVALCYLLGAAAQDVGRVEEARSWFLRVLAIDYAFRDAATRLASLSPPAR